MANQDRIDEMLSKNFTPEQVVKILLHATKIRKLSLKEIKFITDYMDELKSNKVRLKTNFT